MVNVEYYGNKKKQELTDLLCTLESKYYKKPVIYTTYLEFHAYEGNEKYIDLNVYAGSMEDFCVYNHLK